ncbi:hypothetical protein [Streptomyces nanshensis]|uniref:Uncharacterized protein n=1 Tax=Streptomyces nanshensis TaxID=518642 RepID=A0A1E7LAQ9_9ACTN|nr:hypothetical protein [Streptomyces nanshensis]OEV13240.1 hypothetical protein AN218_04485 [Streptomyces nanshensis]
MSIRLPRRPRRRVDLQLLLIGGEMTAQAVRVHYPAGACAEWLPPIARDALPGDAPGEAHRDYNRALKAVVIALDLFGRGFTNATASDHLIRLHAKGLGWQDGASDQCIAMVRADLNAFQASPAVSRGPLHRR